MFSWFISGHPDPLLFRFNYRYRRKPPGGFFQGRWLCYNSGMKKKLMDILACPVCKGELKLTVDKEKGDDVVEGSLNCSKCKVTYTITGSIPNLLPQKPCA